MDGRQPDYPASEQPPAQQYTPTQDPRSATFPPTATPTSEYGVTPSSARSSSFPDYGPRPPYSAPTQAGAMTQQQNPAIATSPTYAPPAQYSPYQTPTEMGHYSHPGVYGRPEWAGGQQYQHPPPIGPHYGHAATSGPPSAGLISPSAQLSTVYSFVPIPGAQQHKRPRRRYEEIERMYKCGWQGCEKAYGTLNHLNAHVTMQSHGAKRTPEEFKEIRKEWKQKKKEEEASRKAEEERARAGDGRVEPSAEGQVYGPVRTPINTGPGPQLPPITYGSPTSTAAQSSYGAPSPANMDNMHSGTFPPHSPYAQNSNLYQQQEHRSNYR